MLALILMATTGAWAKTIYLKDVSVATTAENGDVLTGTLGANVQISIANKATVTLDGVIINGTNTDGYFWAGITCLGDATIILKEGTTNTVKGFRWEYPGIYIPEGNTLTIQGEGSLNVSSNGGAGIGAGESTPIHCGNIVINGGNITATGGDNSAGIGGGNYGQCGNIRITGGYVIATGGKSAAGIGAGCDGPCGTITIDGGTIIATAGDHPAAGDHAAAIGRGDNTGTCGTITIDGNVRQSSIESPYIILADNKDNSSALTTYLATHNGQMSEVTLMRTLYKDGSWNTLCLPFTVSTTTGPLSGDGVQAMTLNGKDSGLSGTTLTLNFDAAPATIAAGTPFIIKWNDTGVNIVNPVFESVTVSSTPINVSFTGGSFKGTYDKLEYPTENKSILFLGEANTLYWPKSGATIGACRAYFQLSPNTNVREFKLSFGEDADCTNGIVEAEANASLFTLHSSLSCWYTLDGRRLSGKPTQRGLYIDNGKKIVIK